jgi:hypothetical protein
VQMMSSGDVSWSNIPAITHETIRGKIIIFSNRRNISPGRPEIEDKFGENLQYLTNFASTHC